MPVYLLRLTPIEMCIDSIKNKKEDIFTYTNSMSR